MLISNYLKIYNLELYKLLKTAYKFKTYQEKLDTYAKKRLFSVF